MKKRSVLLMTVLVFALLFSSISTASAQASSPRKINCVINIAFNFYPDGGYWYGTVTGCSLAGTIKFVQGSKEYYFVGDKEYFFEKFTIWPASGGEIHGYDNGVWNGKTLRFRSTGRITRASEEWAGLVGYRYEETGTTSNPDLLPVTALGTGMTVHKRH